jgi:hypothetical protein
MNPVRRTITISAVALVAAVSTIPLAGSAFACEYVVDPFTGSARCVDAPQPSYDTGASLAWLWISLAVVLATTAAVFLARRRPLKRLPAPAASLKANAVESTGLHTTEQAQIPTPRTAEAEGPRRPVEPEKHPSSR